MPESPHCLIYPSSTQRTDCQVRRACHATAHMTTPESQSTNTWLDFDTENKVLKDQCQKPTGRKLNCIPAPNISHINLASFGLYWCHLIHSQPCHLNLQPYEKEQDKFECHISTRGTMNKGREPSVQQVTSFLLPSLFSSSSSKNPAWTTVVTT